MTSDSYVAALDQGTTSTRCMLFDQQGRMVALAQREHHQHYPQSGWVEHDPLEIWSMAKRVLHRALADIDAEPSQIVGLGITNQRETTVVWDRKTGEPLHNAIVWQDTRASDTLDTIATNIAPSLIRERSGLPLVSYFSGPKLRWLLDHDADLRRRAAAGEVLFGTMDCWLVWNLTGGPDGGIHVTDVTNASRTMLMNIEELCWDDVLTSGLGIPAVMLPEIVSSTGRVGTCKGVLDGVPITAVLGDQQASLFGQTAFEPGDAKCTFGTGSFLLLNTGNEIVRSTHGLITTVAYAIEGAAPVYALEGSVAAAGSLVQWCLDNLGLIRSPAEIETLAATVPDSGGCYVVPAFAGLLAPQWESEARGLIVGLTSFVTKAHVCRAILDAVAWQTRDIVDAMNAGGGTPLARLAVDGGMTSDNLLMQRVSDVLDVPVIRPVLSETVARGAAYAAGIGAGYWPDLRTLRRTWRRAAEWTPQLDPQTREFEFGEWREAVNLAIKWGRRRSRSTDLPVT